ncbi:MAG TPA: signal peptidase II [Micromonosporaceae bacterium]
MQATGGATLNAGGEQTVPVHAKDTGSEQSTTRTRDERRRAPRLMAAVAAIVLLADLATKQLALTNLAEREPARLLGGAVYLTLVHNSGAAFGIGAGYTWVFTLIALAVIGWLVWAVTRLRSLPWAVSFGLILGGALGNLADRIFRAPGPFVGHVVDMVSLFDPYGRVWPVFNLADSALFCGVLLAVYLELTGRQRDGTRISTRSGDSPASTRDQT